MTSTKDGRVVGGRYRLLAELGSGGFGKVWQARDQALDVDVAIKELRLLPGMTEAEQADRLARATREARNAARLRAHENIVAIHDVVVEDGLPWIVMELIEGNSLDEHIKTRGPLAIDAAAELAFALLSAIGTAHEKAVVHRDIKPANVMFTERGRFLLTDFGTAVHNTDTTLTATGMFVGSPEYMAPERLRGEDNLPASDLFSLGVTLYQAVEGFSPFRRDSQAGTLTAVLLEEPPQPTKAGRLTGLIVRLLDKDPANRPTVPEALAMLAGAPTRAHTSPVPRRDTKMLARRDTPKMWQAKAIAVILAVIVAFAIAGIGTLGAVWEATTGDEEYLIFVVAVVVNGLLLGLACTGVTRLLPDRAGQTVAAIVGFGGFAFTGLAVAGAFDGLFALTMALDVTDGYKEGAGVVAMTVITVLALISTGWAWELRKARRASSRLS
ncbi:protein kinase domain-containing protein [Prauserella marina]|nr:protein kinase [Prauserella marina]